MCKTTIEINHSDVAKVIKQTLGGLGFSEEVEELVLKEYLLMLANEDFIADVVLPFSISVVSSNVVLASVDSPILPMV